MAQKREMKQISGEIPSVLAEAFGETIEALGLVKKRAMAAAITAWLNADPQTQMQQYHAVFELYYRDEALPPSSRPGTAKAEIEAAEERIRKKRGPRQKAG